MKKLQMSKRIFALLIATTITVSVMVGCGKKETKTEELLKDIENSTVSNEEKTFLKKAAMRHLAFNYKKIAEYYANSEKDMQDLMEKSALVIIDYNNAIQNGFVRLSKRIKEMCKQNA